MSGVVSQTEMFTHGTRRTDASPACCYTTFIYIYYHLSNGTAAAATLVRHKQIKRAHTHVYDSRRIKRRARDNDEWDGGDGIFYVRVC